MPSSFLGFLLAVAALGPGFLFVRRTSRRNLRPAVSPLGEFVEMVAVGAATTLIALLLAAFINDKTDWLSVSDLVDDPGKALSARTPGWIGAFVAVLALSYAIAWVAAHLLTRKRPPVHLHWTAWQQALAADRGTDRATVVTVQLRDGRLFTGQLGAFTTELQDDREILLSGPVAESLSRDAQTTLINQEFTVVRERDIVAIEGHYVPLTGQD